MLSAQYRFSVHLTQATLKKAHRPPVFRLAAIKSFGIPNWIMTTMVKRFFIFTMLLLLSGTVFSQVTSQLSVGFENANSFEKNMNHYSLYIPSVGINLTNYVFFNGNFGVFLHTDLLFPVSGNFQIYDSSIVISALIGPSFRIPIYSAFEAAFGVGFDVSGTFIRYAHDTKSFGQEKYERNELNLGLGGDIRIKYFISKTFYVNAGSILSWYFSNYSSVISKYGDYARFAQNYSMFSVNPCIGIGLQFPFGK
jgi:hypothetical protein